MGNRVKAARGKADANHKLLKERAIALGFSVIDLAPVGAGVPDLLVSTPLEMWLVEIKKTERMGLKDELTEAQKEFLPRWENTGGKDALIWYELGDVELLFLLCDRAGHFHGQTVSFEAGELRSGRTINVLSPEPKRRGGGYCLPTNISRIPNCVQNLGEGFTSSLELLKICEVSDFIYSSGCSDPTLPILQGQKRKQGEGDSGKKAG